MIVLWKLVFFPCKTIIKKKKILKCKLKYLKCTSYCCQSLTFEVYPFIFACFMWHLVNLGLDIYIFYPHLHYLNPTIVKLCHTSIIVAVLSLYPLSKHCYHFSCSTLIYCAVKRFFITPQ